MIVVFHTCKYIYIYRIYDSGISAFLRHGVTMARVDTCQKRLIVCQKRPIVVSTYLSFLRHGVTMAGVEQALESEFMAALHDEEDEPRAKAALVLVVRLDPPASGPSNQLSTLV